MKIHEQSLGYDEVARLATVNRYRIACSPSEHNLEYFAELACETFEMPVCAITLIDHEKIYIKATFGTVCKRLVPRTKGLLGELLTADEVTVIEDDQHTAAFSAIFGESIDYCAGVAIVTEDGYNIGSLWLMSNKSSGSYLKRESLFVKFVKDLTDRMNLWIAVSENAQTRLQNVKLISENEKVIEKMSNLMDYQEAVTNANSVLENVLDSFEMIFQQAPVAMGICSGAEKRIWQSNYRIQDYFGKVELLGRELDGIIMSVNNEDFGVLLKKVYLSRESYHVEEASVLINFQDGPKYIYANLSLQPVGRMGDEPDNIIFLLDDVTSQIFSKKISEQANEVLLNAIEDTGLGYTIVEFASGQMEANVQMKKNYGYGEFEPFSYKDLFEAILPEFREKIKRAVDEAVSIHGIYQAQYQVRWRDGSIHWLKAYGKPMYDANGLASHIIGFNKIIAVDKSEQ